MWGRAFLLKTVSYPGALLTAVQADAQTRCAPELKDKTATALWQQFQTAVDVWFISINHNGNKPCKLPPPQATL